MGASPNVSERVRKGLLLEEQALELWRKEIPQQLIIAVHIHFYPYSNTHTHHQPIVVHLQQNECSFFLPRKRDTRSSHRLSKRKTKTKEKKKTNGNFSFLSIFHPRGIGDASRWPSLILRSLLLILTSVSRALERPSKVCFYFFLVTAPLYVFEVLFAECFILFF